MRDVRTRLGINRAVFGLRLGVTEEAVSSYERRRRPIPDPVWRNIQHERVALGDFG